MWAGFPASRCLLQYTAHSPPIAGNNTSSTTRSDGGSALTKGEPDMQYYSYSAYSGVVSSVSNNRQQRVEDTANRRSLTNTAHSTSVPNIVVNSVSVGAKDNSVQNSTAVANRENMRVVTWADLDNEDLALANEVSCCNVLNTDLLSMYYNHIRALTLMYISLLFTSQQLRVMCLEYGYSLDPHLTPQRDETRQFTA